jgi:hypothetical protein
MHYILNLSSIAPPVYNHNGKHHKWHKKDLFETRIHGDFHVSLRLNSHKLYNVKVWNSEGISNVL